MGAKGKFTEWLTDEGLLKIEGWARDGLTDEQIAQNIGIRRSTLNEWKKKFPVISDTLKRGKEVVDRQVENALLKKTMGYNAQVKKHMKIKEVIYNEAGFKVSEKESIFEVYDEVHIPADTTAQIFWLKNRKPAEWRDKQQVEHSGSMNVNNPLQGLTTEEIKKLINK